MKQGSDIHAGGLWQWNDEYKLQKDRMPRKSRKMVYGLSKLSQIEEQWQLGTTHGIAIHLCLTRITGMKPVIQIFQN
jgi:hypothetical protein